MLNVFIINIMNSLHRDKSCNIKQAMDTHLALLTINFCFGLSRCLNKCHRKYGFMICNLFQLACYVVYNVLYIQEIIISKLIQIFMDLMFCCNDSIILLRKMFLKCIKTFERKFNIE